MCAPPLFEFFCPVRLLPGELTFIGRASEMAIGSCRSIDRPFEIEDLYNAFRAEIKAFLNDLCDFRSRE